jgi:hypothetical protein
MQIPMGWLADRWNVRWLYAGAFCVVVTRLRVDGKKLAPFLRCHF